MKRNKRRSRTAEIGSPVTGAGSPLPQFHKAQVPGMPAEGLDPYKHFPPAPCLAECSKNSLTVASARLTNTDSMESGPCRQPSQDSEGLESTFTHGDLDETATKGKKLKREKVFLMVPVEIARDTSGALQRKSVLIQSKDEDVHMLRLTNSGSSHEVSRTWSRKSARSGYQSTLSRHDEKGELNHSSGGLSDGGQGNAPARCGSRRQSQNKHHSQNLDDSSLEAVQVTSPSSSTISPRPPTAGGHFQFGSQREVSPGKSTQSSQKTYNKQFSKRSSQISNRSMSGRRNSDDVSSMSTDFGLEVSRVYAEESDINSDSDGDVVELDDEGFLDVMDELEHDPNDIAFDPEVLPLNDSDAMFAMQNHQVKTWGNQQNLAIGVRFGMADTQGNRNTMEDRIMVVGDYKFKRKEDKENTVSGDDTSVKSESAQQRAAFFGVYDGHGGVETAEKLRQNLHKNIIESSDFETDVRAAIEEGCLKTDTQCLGDDFEKMCKHQELFEKGGSRNLTVTNSNFSGSTAVLAIVIKESNTDKCKLYVANVGDCRAVIAASPEGNAEDLTTDHKPSRPDEQERIEEAGGYIHGGRLNGVLAVSRSFGDINHKVFPPPTHLWVTQQLISKPDITVVDLDSSYEFIILACDGLWDVLSSQQAVNYVRRRLLVHHDVQRACQDLVKKALDFGSVDNVSAIVICFNQVLAKGQAMQKLFGRTSSNKSS
mmetsp:Transcript_31572/g.40458  ORF Transcript_31572/g.40458 Transcript_31572/m.40458 type:complete len:711 (+) Transcript_31572:200-2332(+)